MFGGDGQIAVSWCMPEQNRNQYWFPSDVFMVSCRTTHGGVLNLRSSGNIVPGEVRALEERHFGPKSNSRVREREKGLLEGPKKSPPPPH